MPKQLEELIRKIKFGSQDERLQAIIALGDIEFRHDVALLHLLPIATGEETEDYAERIYAIISAAKLGDDEFLMEMNPTIFEYVRDTLLSLLSYYSQHHEKIGVFPIAQFEMIKALTVFRGDKAVLDGLIEFVRCSREDTRLIADDCLCAIGALGDEMGKRNFSNIGKIKVTQQLKQLWNYLEEALRTLEERKRR